MKKYPLFKKGGYFGVEKIILIESQLEHLHEDLIHEKNAIEFYIRHHRKGKAEEMLTQMSEYQELLKPYFKVLSEELYEWQKSPYANSAIEKPLNLETVENVIKKYLL